MLQVKDYKVIIELDLFKLEDKVKDLIDNGWSPLGSPVVRKGSITGYEYIQALVKYKSD